MHGQLNFTVEDFLRVEEVLDMEEFLVVGGIGRVHQVFVNRSANFEWLRLLPDGALNQRDVFIVQHYLVDEQG